MDINTGIDQKSRERISQGIGVTALPAEATGRTKEKTELLK